MDSAPRTTGGDAGPPPPSAAPRSAVDELPPEAIALAGRLFDAARIGQVDVFEQALPRGLPANLTNDKGDTLVSLLSSFHPPFHRSIPLGSSKDVVKQEYGLTTLHQLMLAAYHGHAPLVSLLVRHGADPNRVNDLGQSPLAGVVFKNEREVIKILLEAGADPEIGEPTALEATKVRPTHVCCVRLC